MAHEVWFAGYTFPGNGLKFSPTFGDVVTRTGRLPGLDGGFDEYGKGQAPNEVGNITLSFTLIATTRSAMQAKRDAVLALAAVGKQELRWKPAGFTEFRFCNARVNNIRMPQDPSGQTDLWQPVSMNFQVSDPHWYSYPFNVWYLNDGNFLDDGLNLGGYSPTTAILGVYGFNIEGTADTFPIITIKPNQSGTTITNPRLQRKALLGGGIVLDEFAWQGVLSYGDWLTVNCRDYSVTWYRDGYGAVDGIAAFTHKRAEFTRMQPGFNFFYFLGTISPNTVSRLDVIFEYVEAYR